MNQTQAITRSVSTPLACASSRLVAVARIALPSVVYCSSRWNASTAHGDDRQDPKLLAGDEGASKLHAGRDGEIVAQEVRAEDRPGCE